MTEPLTVVTLNLRSVKDRWLWRAPLVVEQMRELAPDVIALQEASTWAMQARWLAWRMNSWRLRGPYSSWHVATPGRMAVLEGIAVASRWEIVRRRRLHLGSDQRSAMAVTLSSPGGARVVVVNTHFADGGVKRELRLAEVERLLTWTQPLVDRVPLILTGDFNARPQSRTVQKVLNASFRSAHVVANGIEPVRTVPAIPPEGACPGFVLDYIFVSRLVEVESCRVAFDKPSGRDPMRYPSDHLGLVSRLHL